MKLGQSVLISCSEREKSRTKTVTRGATRKKAEMQRVEKRKGNYCRGKISGTMERQSEEGSLNCNKPRAKGKSHTRTHTAYELKRCLVRLQFGSRKTKRCKCNLLQIKPAQTCSKNSTQQLFWCFQLFDMTFIIRWEFSIKLQTP